MSISFAKAEKGDPLPSCVNAKEADLLFLWRLRRERRQTFSAVRSRCLRQGKDSGAFLWRLRQGKDSGTFLWRLRRKRRGRQGRRRETYR